MPLSNNASFVPTMNEFIAHWTQVDAVLTPDLVVGIPGEGAVTLAGFSALRTALQEQFQRVIDSLNDKEIARGEIRLRKARALAHFNEFNAMLDGYWAGTAFVNARAYAPNFSDGQEVFLAPMRDVFSLWEKLNAGAAPAGVVLPLVLSDGTTREEFGEELAGIAGSYVAEAAANQGAVLARSERDGLKERIRAILVSYRTVVPARCAQHGSLVETLPVLTPPPGHTPDAVVASAVFVAPDQARVVYEESAEASLERYELRGNPGEEYSDEDAVVIATNGVADAREFVTGFGLNQPGTVVALKVYVVLDTGNESGSATLTVARPL